MPESFNGKLEIMFDHKVAAETPVSVVLHWMLLSVLAGSVNAGGYLACGKFVSHVTGFATLFGIDAANHKWEAAFGIVSVPIFFLIGVMVSAYLIDRPKHKHQRPHYITVMTLVCLCLVIAATAGNFDLFGGFGKNGHLKQDYLLLALLCAASGLQNAAITTASGHTVRTTHLTGVTTDLGIGIVRAISIPEKGEAYRAELSAAYFRVGTIVAFATGSVIGAALFFKAQYLGFLFPASIAGYVVAHETYLYKLKPASVRLR